MFLPTKLALDGSIRSNIISSAPALCKCHASEIRNVYLSSYPRMPILSLVLILEASYQGVGVSAGSGSEGAPIRRINDRRYFTSDTEP